MTSYLTFYDSAWPPADPPETDGFCCYIGGDTVHVWTLAEIRAQKAQYILPVFVRSNPRGLPGVASDVNAALRELAAIGAPKGTLVAWDMETAADALYIGGVYAGMAAGGYPLIVYGSRSDVFGNKVPDGLYFAADWTGTPHLSAGSVMTQWMNFANYDEDLAEPSLPFWDTKAPVPKPPAPKPTPVPAPNWLEAIVRELPVLQQGSTGEDVRTAQVLLTRWGHPTTTDADFGPNTAASVTALQTEYHLAVDATCGEQTWTVLITGAAP